MRFELMRDKAHWLAWPSASEETGFQDQRRDPGLATSASSSIPERVTAALGWNLLLSFLSKLIHHFLCPMHFARISNLNYASGF
jgi:hypothetical protein